MLEGTEDEQYEEERLACPHCGSTVTVELHDAAEDGPEQSITVCAGCGADD